MGYKDLMIQNKEWIEKVWEKLDEKLSRTSVKSRDKIPYSTKDGVHDTCTDGIKITNWTNGFWGGLMWLMYAGTGKECYKLTAERSEELMDVCFSDYVEELHHDVGFMWHILSGANYRLTGNKRSRNRNLLAAMTLMSRYNVEGNYIRSWNVTWEKIDNAGWTIIDCMMNIPQLYWASRELGDDRFKKIAVRYADMAMRDHVREDGSVNHIVIHDTEKADTVLGTHAGQGYAVGSSWSRGVSWALYGFVLSYIHTKENRYLETAKKVAKHFIESVEKTNYLPLLDFKAPAEPILYDSTAGAIAVCGLIEIAKNVEENQQEYYLSVALKILQAMEKNWCNWEENEDSILQMGSERYERGHHKPIIYGDYFFTEAILKLKGVEFLPW